MGQILGLGYSGGDRKTETSTPKIPQELRQLYGSQTDLAQSLLPAYKKILGGAMSGDESVANTFSAPAAQGYTTNLAATYAPTAGAYNPTAGAFLPGVKAATQPLALQRQLALAQARRQLPAGGGRDAALANILAQSGAGMGAAQGQAAQQDINARNLLTQQDLMAKNQLTQADLLRFQALTGQDVQNKNTLQVQDIQARNAMLQKLLGMYGTIFGGYNPQTEIGKTQTASTSGAVGVPFASIPVGGG